MTEQERQAALDALDKLLKMYGYSKSFPMPGHETETELIKIIRAALSSPAVPVIPGLEEAIKAAGSCCRSDNPVNFKGETVDIGVLWQAARWVAELQKGV